MSCHGVPREGQSTDNLWKLVLSFHLETELKSSGLVEGIFTSCTTLMSALHPLCKEHRCLSQSEVVLRNWRVGSVAKSTCCTCKEPEIDSQNPHGGTQPLLTPNKEI